MITRGQRWIALGAAAATAAVLFTIYLIKSHVALISLNNGVDWAHHVALIDALMRGADLEALRPQLVEFSYQPRAAHIIAAAVANFFRLSSLQSVHIVANAALIVSCAIVAFRLVIVVGATRPRSILVDLAAFIAGVVTLAAFARVGLGFSGQLQWNYFFHQAVGTAVALLCLAAIQWLSLYTGVSRLVIVAAVPVLSWFTALFHTVPAIWLAASGGACVLGLFDTWPRRIIAANAAGMVSAAAIFSLRGSREVLRMGGLVVSDLNIVGLRLSHAPSLLAGGACVLVILFAARLLAHRHEVNRLLIVHGGAIGLVLISLAFVADYFISQLPGFYSLAKFAYLFAAEVALLTAGIVGSVLYRIVKTRDWPPTLVLPITALAVAVATLAQGYAVRYFLSDQRFLIAAQETIAAWPNPKPTLYPLFDAFSSAEKYYLFLAPMGHARTNEAYELLMDANADRDSALLKHIIPPHMLNGAIHPWAGDRITLADGSRRSYFLFAGGWSRQPDGVRWIAGSVPAQLFAFVPEFRFANRACLELSYKSWKPAALRIQINKDGGIVKQLDASPAGQTLTVPVLIGAEGDLEVELTKVATPGDGDNAMRIDAVRLSVDCNAS